jgi:isoquinoline 1-oxidoreductase alpha subunit
MALAAMLEANPSPSEEAIAALPNICRCGAYPGIRKAIGRASAAMAAARSQHEQTAQQQFSRTSSAESHNSPQ